MLIFSRRLTKDTMVRCARESRDTRCVRVIRGDGGPIKSMESSKNFDSVSTPFTPQIQYRENVLQ